MERTNKYDEFKFVEGNRNLTPKHVHNLIESMKKESLLHIRPILVDENMCILDGQHRFEAAKLLGLDIYYIKIKSENHDEILKLNQNNKNWKIIDFLNFHCLKNKNTNYLKIMQILNTYGWNLNDFFLYENYNIRKRKERTDFENGFFIVENSEEHFADCYSKWKCLKDFLESKGVDHVECIETNVFKDSFLYFHNSKSIKLDQFWEKIKSYVNLFHRCSNKDQYLDMFLRIYNQACTYKIEKGTL